MLLQKKEQREKNHREPNITLPCVSIVSLSNILKAACGFIVHLYIVFG